MLRQAQSGATGRTSAPARAPLQSRCRTAGLRRRSRCAAAPARASRAALFQVQEGREARAPHAVFYNLEQRIVLSGGVDLLQGANSLRGDTVVVLVRGKRVTVRAVECRRDQTDEAPGVAAVRLPAGVRLSRRPGTQTGDELHLVGRTVDEALPLVDKYLDDAYLAGRSPVRLIHGTGSGRLRRAIAGLLARHPQVESFAGAPPEQGGAGVTVVTLRI